MLSPAEQQALNELFSNVQKAVSSSDQTTWTSEYRAKVDKQLHEVGWQGGTIFRVGSVEMDMNYRLRDPGSRFWVIVVDERGTERVYVGTDEGPWWSVIRAWIPGASKRVLSLLQQNRQWREDYEKSLRRDREAALARAKKQFD